MRKTNDVTRAIQYIITKLFAAHYFHIGEILESISRSQYELKKSPNFFYKGKYHIRDKDYSVPSLHAQLKESYQSYLDETETVSKNRIIVSNYLNTVASVTTHYAHIYYLLPDSLLKHLELDMKDEYKPDYLEEVRPSNYDEFLDTVQEELIYSLLK